MTNQPIHILNQMGVITSFSVAKKISGKDINKFFSRGKHSGKSEPELEQMLKEKIIGEIQDAIITRKVPGLLSPQELAKEMGLSPQIANNVYELNRMIMVIAHKLLEKKYDKMSLCYFINSLVNLLGLQESDFEKFHRQNNRDDDDDENSEYKDA